MLTDVWTIARKELLEKLLPASKKRSGLGQAAVLVLLLGIWFPVTIGSADYLSSWFAVYLACFSGMMTMNMIPDLYAGERERHTLETLLASRLPDRAILYGKTLAVMIYSWMLMVIGQLVAAVVINVLYPQPGLRFFTPEIAVSMVVATFAVSALITGMGTLVSLRASTVQQANQRLMVPFMLVAGLPVVIPILLSQLLPPETFADFLGAVGCISVFGLVMIGAALVAVIAVMLLAVAEIRFKRARLILD